MNGHQGAGQAVWGTCNGGGACTRADGAEAMHGRIGAGRVGWGDPEYSFRGRAWMRLLGVLGFMKPQLGRCMGMPSC